eukprot:10500851-Lingulodinium_polyedra.AAC.1
MRGESGVGPRGAFCSRQRARLGPASRAVPGRRRVGRGSSVWAMWRHSSRLRPVGRSKSPE